MTDYQRYLYYPTLRTRQSEIEAVSNLSEETKGKILPIVSLSRLRKLDGTQCVDKWLEAFSGQTIVDIEKSHAIALDNYKDITSPENNHKNWISFVKTLRASNNGFIPCAQLTEGATRRQYAQQVMALENMCGKTAIRINPLQKKGILAATTAASILDDIDNGIFIFDIGQINAARQKISMDACIRGINQLRDIEPSIEIVVTGSSFPRSFPEYGRTCGEIPMLEWNSYQAMGGEDVALYGDYASIHGEFYPGSYARFVARVDYPTLGSWIYERRAGDDERGDLYQEAALAITQNEEWDHDLNAWGAKIISRVANGNTDKMKSPAKWIALRVNLHIERMVEFIESGATSDIPLEDEYWDDEEDVEGWE